MQSNNWRRRPHRRRVRCALRQDRAELTADLDILGKGSVLLHEHVNVTPMDSAEPAVPMG